MSIERDDTIAGVPAIAELIAPYLREDLDPTAIATVFVTVSPDCPELHPTIFWALGYDFTEERTIDDDGRWLTVFTLTRPIS